MGGRDDARTVLVAMVAELGPEYLPFAITVLRSALPAKGYMGHVLGFTLHAVLAALVQVRRAGVCAACRAGCAGTQCASLGFMLLCAARRAGCASADPSTSCASCMVGVGIKLLRLRLKARIPYAELLGAPLSRRQEAAKRKRA